jgi:hypothetical protein
MTSSQSNPWYRFWVRDPDRAGGKNSAEESRRRWRLSVSVLLAVLAVVAPLTYGNWRLSALVAGLGLGAALLGTFLRRFSIVR